MSEVKENNYEELILAKEYNLLQHGQYSKALVIAPVVRDALSAILTQKCNRVFVKASRINGKVVLELTPRLQDTK